jgi:hypothetical protein
MMNSADKNPNEADFERIQTIGSSKESKQKTKYRESTKNVMKEGKSSYESCIEQHPES